jgi:hypothetical protein
VRVSSIMKKFSRTCEVRTTIHGIDSTVVCANDDVKICKVCEQTREKAAKNNGVVNEYTVFIGIKELSDTRGTHF